MRAKASRLDIQGPRCPCSLITQRFVQQRLALTFPFWLAVRPRLTPGKSQCSGFQSRPMKPHPLFKDFIRAACMARKK